MKHKFGTDSKTNREALIENDHEHGLLGMRRMEETSDLFDFSREHGSFLPEDRSDITGNLREFHHHIHAEEKQNEHQYVGSKMKNNSRLVASNNILPHKSKQHGQAIWNVEGVFTLNGVNNGRAKIKAFSTEDMTTKPGKNSNDRPSYIDKANKSLLDPNLDDIETRSAVHGFNKAYEFHHTIRGQNEALLKGNDRSLLGIGVAKKRFRLAQGATKIDEKYIHSLVQTQKNTMQHFGVVLPISCYNHNDTNASYSMGTYTTPTLKPNEFHHLSHETIESLDPTRTLDIRKFQQNEPKRRSHKLNEVQQHIAALEKTLSQRDINPRNYIGVHKESKRGKARPSDHYEEVKQEFLMNSLDNAHQDSSFKGINNEAERNYCFYAVNNWFRLKKYEMSLAPENINEIVNYINLDQSLQLAKKLQTQTILKNKETLPLDFKVQKHVDINQLVTAQAENCAKHTKNFNESVGSLNASDINYAHEQQNAVDENAHSIVGIQGSGGLPSPHLMNDELEEDIPSEINDQSQKSSHLGGLPKLNHGSGGLPSPHLMNDELEEDIPSEINDQSQKPPHLGGLPKLNHGSGGLPSPHLMNDELDDTPPPPTYHESLPSPFSQKNHIDASTINPLHENESPPNSHSYSKEEHFIDI